MSQALRRILGIFIPGSAWVVFLAWRYADTIPSTFLLHNPVILVTTFFLLSYVIGALNLMIAFRLAGIIGDTVDAVITALTVRSRFMKVIIDIVSRYLHIFDLTPLEQRRRDSCPLSEAEQVENARYANLSDICKMHIIAESPRLSQPVLEVEAEINYYAGTSLPILILGLALVSHMTWAGILLILLSIWHILRYQHLRHHEVDVIYLAYRTLYKGQPKA